MGNCTGGPKKSNQAENFGTVVEGLQRVYFEKLLPLEREHLYHTFYAPEHCNADFAARPMVLLLGQYSTGKSTFIRHLLGRDYPNLIIGPEPTTDKFVAVMHSDRDSSVPGNALVADHSMPFTQLSMFGNAFLSRFEAALLPSRVLDGFTLIDTPGVLAGEKQRLNRGYEFEQIVKWFADRVDIILILFDVSKLDISDEFRRVILAARGNDHKIKIVLNKCDRVSTPQLMRVYGALMWSLGKVLDTPEVSRVYVGSYWDEPLQNDEQRKLFESEENDLYTMLAQLPRGAALRKINDLVKRARLAKVHAYILDALCKKMPSMFGKEKAKKKLINGLADIYQEIAKTKNLAIGDFPDVTMMQSKLSEQDFTTFKPLKPKYMDALESFLSVDVPVLMTLLPDEVERISRAEMTQVSYGASPFAAMKVDGFTEHSPFQREWLQKPNVEEYKADFLELAVDDKVTAAKARGKMLESKLPSSVLHNIWTLADIDKDGHLTLYEYALAMHFVKMRLDGLDLPLQLPESMLPLP